MKAGKTGVTTNTPKNIMFGAGTIHKDLAYTTPEYSLTSDVAVVAGKTYYTRSGTSSSYVYTVVQNPVTSEIGSYYELTSGGWNFAESLYGATQGGSKVTIKPEMTKVEVDGALVATKGLEVKTGETATMEINFIEITKDIMKASVIGVEGVSEDANFTKIESKPKVESGDYLDNIAFVGETLDGRNIIVIMDNALCTSGFESSGKNKEAGVFPYTFECHADLNSDLDTLPYHIYYPNDAE